MKHEDNESLRWWHDSMLLYVLTALGYGQVLGQRAEKYKSTATNGGAHFDFHLTSGGTKQQKTTSFLKKHFLLTSKQI